MKIVYNVTEEEANEIKRKIKENGGHCLCAIKKTMNTKCMCQNFRDKIEKGYFGSCDCGLYKSIPNVIYICGNSFYTKDYIYWNDYFSKQGMLVMLPGELSSGYEKTDNEKTNLENLSEQKIQFADIIFIVDKYGKIADDMNKIIEHAKKNGKKILFASEMND